ncbi:MAG: hypothetical protein WC860_04910 [Candidatus Margulisiibacteriota bacterium]|jgi:hypothetical protein
MNSVKFMPGQTIISKLPCELQRRVIQHVSLPTLLAIRGADRIRKSEAEAEIARRYDAFTRQSTIATTPAKVGQLLRRTAQVEVLKQRIILEQKREQRIAEAKSNVPIGLAAGPFFALYHSVTDPVKIVKCIGAEIKASCREPNTDEHFDLAIAAPLHGLVDLTFGRVLGLGADVKTCTKLPIILRTLPNYLTQKRIFENDLAFFKTPKRIKVNHNLEDESAYLAAVSPGSTSCFNIFVPEACSQTEKKLVDYLDQLRQPVKLFQRFIRHSST